MRGRVTRVWFWKPFIRHNYVGSQSLHLLRSILPSPGGHRYSIQHWNLTQHGELLHLWLVSDFNIKHYNFKNQSGCQFSGLMSTSMAENFRLCVQFGAKIIYFTWRPSLIDKGALSKMFETFYLCCRNAWQGFSLTRIGHGLGNN